MGKTRKWPGEIEQQCRVCGDLYYVRQREIDNGQTTCSRSCNRTRPVAERFWEKVNKDGPVPAHAPHLGECWVWIGATSGSKGHKWKYGMLGIGKDGSSPQPAHRVSWALHNGPIPPGIQILHKCDNPPCVRPTHLKLGTGKDNIQDMIRKGRDANTRAPRPYHNGSENPAAKLTEEDIIAIRKEYAKGNVTHQILAERYGTSQTNIHLIVHRLKWKHI